MHTPGSPGHKEVFVGIVKDTASVVRSLEKHLPQVGWFKQMREDRFSQIAFGKFVEGFITTPQYWDLMDKFHGHISGYVAKESFLKGKLDRRSLGEFSVWIYHQTIREAFLMQSWRDMLLDAGLFKTFEFEEHGCDHRGRLLLFPAKQGKMADYKVQCSGGKLLPDGKHLIEVKFDPSLTKFTLKTKDIESYLEQQAYVMCVLCDDCMVGPNGEKYADDIDFVLPQGKTYWCLISPDALRRIHEERAVSDRREMGDKKSIQLRPDDFEKYFVVEQWGNLCRQRDGLARPWEDNK